MPDEEGKVPEEGTEEKPRPKLFLAANNKDKVPAGGRAAGQRTRPPGSKFNKPSQDQLDYYEETSEEREEFIADDPVVKSAAEADPIKLLATLKAEVAREAAALHYQRKQNEIMGKDITRISARRIDAMKKIADIEMEMRKIGFDQVDIYSEKFQKIFKLWTDMIRVAAEETLAPEQLDLFFNKLQTEMEGWEEKAENLVR